MNGHTNGYTSDHTNDETNDLNGHTSGHVNGYVNGHTNGSSGHGNSIENLSDEKPKRLFLLSSFDEAAGKRQLENLKGYLEARLEETEETFMDDLAYTLNERRTDWGWKAALSVRSPVDLVDALGTNLSFVNSVKKPTLGFIFTGQGAQWCGMGKELIGLYPEFSLTLEKIGQHLAKIGAPFGVLGK